MERTAGKAHARAKTAARNAEASAVRDGGADVDVSGTQQEDALGRKEEEARGAWTVGIVEEMRARTS